MWLRSNMPVFLDFQIITAYTSLYKCVFKKNKNIVHNIWLMKDCRYLTAQTFKKSFWTWWLSEPVSASGSNTDDILGSFFGLGTSVHPPKFFFDGFPILATFTIEVIGERYELKVLSRYFEELYYDNSKSDNKNYLLVIFLGNCMTHCVSQQS